MPKLGDILFYKDYEFEDKSKSDKLFVVLCSDESCLVLKTTSNDRFYKNAKDGCNPSKRTFFIPVSKKEFFVLDTYVELPQLFELSIEEILHGLRSKNIKIYESKLSKKCTQAILECLRQFKDDISIEHWEMILSKVKSGPSCISLQMLADKFNNK
jgi:hypothetical protein